MYAKLRHSLRMSITGANLRLASANSFLLSRRDLRIAMDLATAFLELIELGPAISDVAITVIQNSTYAELVAYGIGRVVGTVSYVVIAYPITSILVISITLGALLLLILSKLDDDEPCNVEAIRLKMKIRKGLS